MNKLIQWPKAEYWDKPWNPVVGCTPVSEGCENCYAAAMMKRFDRSFKPRPASPKPPPKSGVVFVGNMTDLFGEWNSDTQIIEWLRSLSDDAVNLILTKRARRMSLTCEDLNPEKGFWFGVTGENQERLERRLKHLLCTPSHTRWLSLEPLLGPIDLSQYLAPPDIYYAVKCNYCGWSGMSRYCPGGDDYYTCPKCWRGEPVETGDRFMDWVVVGAESGPNRRPCKVEWVELIVEQCRDAGVPVFVKQLDLNGKLVKDINQFPKHLQIRQVPWEAQR